MKIKKTRSALACAVLLGMAGTASAQLVINEKLTGASSTFGWQAINGACLTAGNNAGSIPACVGLPYYSGKDLVGGDTGTMPDAVGRGALRLTNGARNTGTNGNYQKGAVYSKFDFGSDEGIKVSFKTVTYGGNGLANMRGARSGADGMVFFLTDGTKVTSVNSSTPLGAAGGHLGYSCGEIPAYNPAAGLPHAYLAVGMDEFGNFGNPGDSIVAGAGPGPAQGRVLIKGAGNTTWEGLQQAYPEFYPSSIPVASRNNILANTCSRGRVYNGTGATVNGIPNGGYGPILPTNYRKIAVKDFPTNLAIYNQQAISTPKRIDARAITYGLKITKDSKLSLSYSINGGAQQPIITEQNIATTNAPMPSKFKFGFSAATGGGSNVHEILCFKVEQVNAASSSAGVNIKESAKVQAGSQLYFAFYNQENWTGQLTARDIVQDAATGALSLSQATNWDASCTLTGGQCATTNTNVTAITPDNRVMMTWNGSQGTPLRWSSLNTAQKTALDSTSVGASSSPALDFIRGDRSNEIGGSGSGQFRSRKSVLADIVSSSPTWVGAPSTSDYKRIWKDALYPDAVAPENTNSYESFANSLANRTHVVYVGANDGLLHGFRAGSTGMDGTFNGGNNDGKELLAFMPNKVVSTINTAYSPTAYPSLGYAHNAFVDATPGVGELYFGGTWKTWLVGGMGAGGNASGIIGDRTSIGKGAIFALDVTNPANFTESQSSSLVVGEWSSDDIMCVNDTASTKCKTSMGNTYGTPLIRRLHDGNWAIIFGNGFNSASGKAGVFVVTINQHSGTKSIRFLDTGATSANNGIAYVSSADLDSDSITDYLYAGDLNGNVWRFDLTSNTPSLWAVKNTPVFSVGAPISSRISISAALSNSEKPRLVLNFGTGLIYQKTLSSDVVPATGTHGVYGIWDWDMSGWNAKSTKKYESLSGSQNPTVADLTPQIITDVDYNTTQISGARTVSQNQVCWSQSMACESNNNKFGWKMMLPGLSEQVTYNPTLTGNLLFVNTSIQKVPGATSCDDNISSGFTMAVQALSGNPAKNPVFYDEYNKLVTNNTGIVAGISINGVGSASVLNTANGQYLGMQTISGDGSLTKLNLTGMESGRKTWLNLR